jgi:transcription initiation factor TFIIB
MIMRTEKGDKDSISRCSICNIENTTITDPNSGEIVCSNCGVVLSDKIEDTLHSERHAYTFEEAYEGARTGPPSSLARHGYGAIHNYRSRG